VTMGAIILIPVFLEHVFAIMAALIAIYQSVRLHNSKLQNNHLKTTLKGMLENIPYNREIGPAMVLGATALADTTSGAKEVLLDNGNIVIDVGGEKLGTDKLVK
jgi:hypothetical protein